MEKLTPITRREVFLAKAAGQNVETPTPVTREEVFLDEIAKGGGGGEKFIVTLTPTAEDFSGTMDKTIAEINAAYESGKEIWFSMDDGNGLTYNVLCDDVLVDSSNTYPSFGSKVIVILMGALVYLFTGTTNDGTGNTYSTAIYPLASSGGGVMVVHDVEGTLDKTWQEIHDSDFAVLKRADGTFLVTTGTYEEDGEYSVGFFTYGADPLGYIATSASGYPVVDA